MKQSLRIALGGIVSCLSLVMMFFTGVFPFAEYALPAISGVLLTVLVIEFGFRSALIAFAAVSFLSLVVTPNKEAVVLFIAFLGYYPIVKGKIETLRRKAVQWVVMQDFAMLKIGVWVLLALGNAVFFLYDVAVTRLISMYIFHIKPKYLSKIH